MRASSQQRSSPDEPPASAGTSIKYPWKQTMTSAILAMRRLFIVFTPLERKMWWSCWIALILSGSILIFLFFQRNLTRIPSFGGEYVEGVIGRAQYVNPLFAPANEVDRDLTRLLYAGLVRPAMDGSLVVQMDLAETITVSEDQKTYTVVLKSGLRWHDGQPLTIGDVLFTFESIQNPLWGSPLNASFRGAIFSKIDDRTMTIALPQPFSPFIQTLSVGILPQHLWKNVLPPNARLAEFNIKPIGAGPFRFATLKRMKEGALYSYTVERNSFYHNQKPYLDRITLRFFDTPGDAYTALQAKDIDGLNVVPKELNEAIKSLPFVRMILLRLPQYSAIFFNQRQAPELADPVLREALLRSINKSKVLEIATDGNGEVIHTPILPGMLGHNSALSTPEFDLERAEKLFDTTAWKRVSNQQYAAMVEKAKEKTKIVQLEIGNLKSSITNTASALPPLPYRRFKQSQELSLTITTPDQDALVRSAQQIASLWRSIGINATVAVAPAEKIQQILRERTFDLLLYGQIIGSDPDPFPFWHSSQAKAPGLNLAQFSNIKADKLLEQARATTNPEIRSKHYQEFQKILMDQLPAIFLYRPTYTYLLPTTIQGYSGERISKPADRWNTITNWYKKTKWVWKE